MLTVRYIRSTGKGNVAAVGELFQVHDIAVSIRGQPFHGGLIGEASKGVMLGLVNDSTIDMFEHFFLYQLKPRLRDTIMPPLRRSYPILLQLLSFIGLETVYE